MQRQLRFGTAAGSACGYFAGYASPDQSLVNIGDADSKQPRGHIRASSRINCRNHTLTQVLRIWLAHYGLRIDFDTKVESQIQHSEKPADSVNPENALAEYFQIGLAVNKSREEFDTKITLLVGDAVGEGVPAGPYSDSVYEAVLNLAGAIHAWHAVACYRVTYLDEYEAELARRRQIGPTVDPAHAETTVRVVDFRDPYDILNPSYHVGRRVREYFARNPGGDWIHFGDLPDATDDALWERDGRILVEIHEVDQYGYYVVIQAACNERVAEPDYDARCAEPDARTR